MKHSIFLIFIYTILLSACGGNDNSRTNESSETPEPIAETITLSIDYPTEDILVLPGSTLPHVRGSFSSNIDESNLHIEVNGGVTNVSAEINFETQTWIAYNVPTEKGFSEMNLTVEGSGVSITDQSSLKLTNTGVFNIQSLDKYQENSLIFAEENQDQIYTYNIETNEYQVLVESLEFENTLFDDTIYSTSFNSTDNEYYIVTEEQNKVVKIDLTSSAKETVYETTSPDGEIEDIAYSGEEQSLYILNTQGIYKLNTSTSTLDEIINIEDIRPAGEDSFWRVTSIGISEINNALYAFTTGRFGTSLISINLSELDVKVISGFDIFYTGPTDAGSLSQAIIGQGDSFPAASNFIFDSKHNHIEYSLSDFTGSNFITIHSIDLNSGYSSTSDYTYNRGFTFNQSRLAFKDTNDEYFLFESSEGILKTNNHEIIKLTNDLIGEGRSLTSFAKWQIDTERNASHLLTSEGILTSINLETGNRTSTYKNYSDNNPFGPRQFFSNYADKIYALDGTFNPLNLSSIIYEVDITENSVIELTSGSLTNQFLTFDPHDLYGNTNGSEIYILGIDSNDVEQKNSLLIYNLETESINSFYFETFFDETNVIQSFFNRDGVFVFEDDILYHLVNSQKLYAVDRTTGESRELNFTLPSIDFNYVYSTAKNPIDGGIFFSYSGEIYTLNENLDIAEKVDFFTDKENEHAFFTNFMTNEEKNLLYVIELNSGTLIEIDLISQEKTYIAR